MKLPKGPLKVITFCTEETLEENERRSRAGGKIFHPVVRVGVQAEITTTPTKIVTGVSVTLPAGAEVKSSITTFPHQWSVPSRARVRYWIETTEAVEIITSTEDQSQ